MLLKLDLENLRVIDDGRLEAAFAQELKHVVLDLMDRPGDDRERSVTFKTKFNPVCDETGQCESVNVIRDSMFNAAQADLLPAIRRLDFTRRSDGSRTVEHGRESLGKSVEETVQSRGGELNEFYTFNVSMFANDLFGEFRWDVKTSLDMDVPSEKLRFAVHGDDLVRAKLRALKFVRKSISGLLPSATVTIASHSSLPLDND